MTTQELLLPPAPKTVFCLAKDDPGAQIVTYRQGNSASSIPRGDDRRSSALRLLRAQVSFRRVSSAR